MRRLILLRHGETAWNAAGRWQGHADIELSQAGVLQAKAVAARLAELQPEFVIGSDLARAARTAQIVAEAAGVVASYDERLREIHVGEISGLTGAEAIARFGPGPYDHSEHGGEHRDQVVVRMLAVVHEALARLHDGATGVLVGHGAALRIAVPDIVGWPAEVVPTLGSLANCGWIELTEEAPTSERQLRWRLAAYNRVAPIS
ncbi:MAG: histidine phosphatase family protein [Nocardioides sp.]|uniref:histidine phosphatase family protein n=1 Tax=Nocardioides sp. TaxID=35761 RepID=UPI0039E6E731